jgi:hypothetical protein
MPLKAKIGLGRLVVFLIPILSLVAAGCGSSAGTVSGKVYYKNAPVKGGNITFVKPDKSVSKLSEIQEDGSYKLEKVPPGEMLISVDTSSFKAAASMSKSRMAPPPGKDAPQGYDFAAKAQRYTPIPERYSNPEQSGLKYTVKNGSQEHDIKLE